VTSSSTGLALHESSYWELPEVREGSAFETAFVWMRSVPKNINERNSKAIVVLHNAKFVLLPSVLKGLRLNVHGTLVEVISSSCEVKGGQTGKRNVVDFFVFLLF
jgi:hypothetical protein